MTGELYSEGFALMKQGCGQYTIGLGPFEDFPSAPGSGTAFYCNDFQLNDPNPWKVPARVLEIENLDQFSNISTDLKIDWAELDSAGFARVFTEINENITRGVIEKSVPVSTERGEVLQGSVKSLIGNMKVLGDPFYSYGWNLGERGFCGTTPELLFQLDDLKLKTMALAGTARYDEKEVFAVDGKEIREHEFVAQTLVAKLADIGHVQRAERSIMDLGKIVHFHTSIEVDLSTPHCIDALISRLHPTPALGPLPRHTETLRILSEWRDSLDCPPYFGAPFGLLKDGVFTAVVAIRGVHWDGNKVAIPSGCGVIEASRLVNEWRELRLKREAVKDVFGLNF